MSDFLNGFSWAVEDSFDSMFKKRKANLKKVSSLDDLDGFIRISSDTLISKSEKDLWKVEEGDDGSLLIYRLFDSKESPLKV